MTGPDRLLARIQRAAGVPDLVEVLTGRLAPTDLQSLLLEVYRQLAARVTPARLLERYRQDRFAAPAGLDPRRVAAFETAAFALLPPGYEPIELSPVCPLGTNSAIATVHQDKVVTTVRGSEVLADPTNVMALECAVRRRAARGGPGERAPVRLAASQRVLRAPKHGGAKSFAHFRLLALVAAGPDDGSRRFVVAHLLEQLGFYLALLDELARRGETTLARPRVAVTDLRGGELGQVLSAQVLAPLAARFPGATLHLDPTRESGRGYYRDVCFKIRGTDAAGQEWDVVDGGMTDWTQKLLASRKERLLISGAGVERLLLRD